MVFSNVHADTVVLELLQDIPPHWQVTYAGVDARFINEDFAFVGISHPSGDAESIAIGRAKHKLEQPNTDDWNETANEKCSGTKCANYLSLLDEGSMAPGSSGSGLIHAGLRRVVGVASLSQEPYCAGVQPEFGAMSRAWVEGMYRLWPNATADKPIQADYEPYAVPLPTITIGNIVPELSPAVGPATISIQLQQEPTEPVNVTLHVDSTAFRVSLSRYTVSFNSSDWNKPQLVHIQAEEDVPEEEGAAEFRLDLSWPAAWANGTLVQRSKTIRGIARPPIEGTSMLNPIPVPGNDSFYMETEFRMFNPELPLVSENDGPFNPGVVFSYNRSTSDVLLISMCPKSGSIMNDTKLSVEPYGANFQAGGTVLFTSLEVEDDRYTGCSLSFVASPRNADVHLRVHSTYNWSVPGFSIDLEGELAIAMDTLTPAEGLDLLTMKGDRAMKNPENYTESYVVCPGSHLTAFLPEKSGLYHFSTCDNFTNVDTAFDVWSGETLEPIASIDSKGYDCAELEDVPMQAGKPYFAFLRSQRRPEPVRRVQEALRFSATLVEETEL
ncbi:hypothetical protein QBZ16_005060 [Prototheca wickerhamii]|uniref:Peptidase S1 domain-containing protein n=1 Tax=Prototheca wickerhamii TaxID=3111 RepID=A0AAD9IEI0_PROWI|nr:hypothetical protein QBZ16_005060 [Prototheca wickerhamii]